MRALTQCAIGGILRREEVRLGAGFVFAAADDSGSLQIELRQIGAGFPTFGREFDGAFELRANFFGHAGGSEKTDAIRLLAVDAAQPEMIEAVVGRESNSFFAGGNAGVPIVELEVSAAEQVVGFRSRRNADLLLEGLHGLIYAAGGEKFFRCFGHCRDRGKQHADERHKHGKNASVGRNLKSRFLTGLAARFGMTKVVQPVANNPLHGLRHHLYAGAVDQGLVGVGRGQGYDSILGKAGCDFDLRKVLQGDFHFAAF